jgi:hypothetical protein
VKPQEGKRKNERRCLVHFQTRFSALGILCPMRQPLFVRPLPEEEHRQLRAGLRSSDALVARRCQRLLASAHGERAAHIAQRLGGDDHTVRTALQAFDRQGVACLHRGSSRPHTLQAPFAGQRAEHLRALLHHSPRTFGTPPSVWALEVAAEVSFEKG